MSAGEALGKQSDQMSEGPLSRSNRSHCPVLLSECPGLDFKFYADLINQVLPHPKLPGIKKRPPGGLKPPGVLRLRSESPSRNVNMQVHSSFIQNCPNVQKQTNG